MATLGAKLVVCITSQSFFDPAGYIKEQGLMRLFKNRDGDGNTNIANKHEVSKTFYGN